MFRNAISLKPVVETYMVGATPLYNGEKTSYEFSSDFPFI